MFASSLRSPIRFFNSSRPARKSSSKNPPADTALHQFLRQCDCIHEFREFIKKYPAEEMARMAVMVNDQGKIPTQEINGSNNLKTQEEIKNTLMKIIHLHQKVKPLNELLDEKPSHANPELSENLHLAHEIINEIRSTIKYSPSHPDSNHLSVEERYKFIQRIDMIRSLVKDNPEKFMENIFRYSKQYETGNCWEMTFSSLHMLQLKAKSNLSAMAVSIKDGRHIFAVFGSNLLLDPNDYINTHHETDAVFMDAWKGYYGALNRESLNASMGCANSICYDGHTRVNFISPLNLNYHQLVSNETIKISPHPRFFDKVKKPAISAEILSNTFRKII